MEPAIKPNFLLTPKQFPSDYPLFYTNLPKSTPYSHSLLGLPLIPLLGRYSRDGYVIDEVKGLMILTTRLDLSKNQHSFTYGGSNYRINLPKEVQDLLINIPEKIPHNKPLEKPENQAKNYKKHKENPEKQAKNHNSKPDFPSKPYKKPEIFDFHPVAFHFQPQIRVVWSISFPNRGGGFALEGSKTKDDFKNILNHSWVFEHLDFSFKKKLIANIPCCIAIPAAIEKTCDVQPYLNDGKGVNFGSLRSEYLSTHIIKESLGLSPNNMRIKVDKRLVLAHFWAVYLKETDEHMAVYHWVFNDLEELFEGFLKECGSAGEFLARCGDILGETHEAVQQIRTLFSDN